MIEALRRIIEDTGLRVSTLTLFCLGFTYASTYPYLSIIAMDELDLSAQVFGALMFATSLISTFGVVIIGHFSDQASNRKQAILVSFATGAIGFSAFAIWPSITTFALCLLVFFPIAGAAFPQLYAVIRSVAKGFGNAEAASINSVVRAVFAGSWILVPGFVGAYIAWSGKVSDAFGIAAIAYVFCFFVYWFYGPYVAREKVSHQKPLEGLIDAFRTIGSKSILSRVLSLAMIGVTHPINAAIMPLMVLEMDGGSTRDVGILAGLVAALEIPFMLLGGALVRRIPIVWIIAAGGICHATYLLALMSAGSLSFIYALTFLNAAGAAIMLSLHLSYLQDCLPDRPGLGTSLHSVENLVMRSLSAGIIAGIGLMFGLEGALLIAAVAGGVGICLLLFVDRKTALI